jgi:uncharacterized RDD family membrane protein YckC
MSTINPGLSRRMACLFYEGLVVFALLLIGFLIPQALLSGAGISVPGKLLWVHALLLLMLYFVWFWLNAHGQTLPMKTWRLRVVDINGGPLRPMQAVLRYLAAWPSILLFGIGILWFLVDRDKQFLHDRIAGTRIVSAD